MVGDVKYDDVPLLLGGYDDVLLVLVDVATKMSCEMRTLRTGWLYP